MPPHPTLINTSEIEFPTTCIRNGKGISHRKPLPESVCVDFFQTQVRSRISSFSISAWAYLIPQRSIIGPTLNFSSPTNLLLSLSHHPLIPCLSDCFHAIFPVPISLQGQQSVLYNTRPFDLSLNSQSVLSRRMPLPVTPIPPKFRILATSTLPSIYTPMHSRRIILIH